MLYLHVHVQVDKSPSVSSAIDLVLSESAKVDSVPVQKPKLSQKAWNRLSNRNRRKVNPGGSGAKTASSQPRENSPSDGDTGEEKEREERERGKRERGGEREGREGERRERERGSREGMREESGGGWEEKERERERVI